MWLRLVMQEKETLQHYKQDVAFHLGYPGKRAVTMVTFSCEYYNQSRRGKAILQTVCAAGA